MDNSKAVILILSGLLLFLLGYAQRKGGKAHKWASRVLALVLFAVLAVLLDAISADMAGIGVLCGALVLAAVFKPWRGA